MTWFLAGIIPPILWAIVNHTDKYLLSKSNHHSSVNVLMVYSTSFSLLVIPILLFLSYKELFISLEQVIIQVIGGILLTASIYFYLLALHKDETSNVVPLFLLVPIFGYIFSYFILGEFLSIKQLIACVIVIMGALILSLEFNEDNKIKIKHGIIGMMILCTIFQAAQETLFKLVTINNSFLTSLFWMQVGILIYGLILISIKRNLFSEFINSIKINGKLMFGVNIISEAMSTLAYMIMDYATLLAPIVVIMTLNSYQPAFVFILGIILTILIPKFVSEKIKPIHIIHKTVAIGIMTLGTLIITQTL